MLSNKKKLAKNSLVYAFFTLLQKGFAFFLIPLYTTQLSTEEYGLLGIVMAAVPFLVLIAGLSLRGSTAYFYYEYRDHNKYLRKLWGTSFTFLLVISFLFVLILWLTKNFLLNVFLEDIPFYPYLFLALISICTQPTYYFFQSILKAKQLANKAAIFDFIYFFIIVVLTLIFILGFNFKAEGALLALAIANISFFVISLVYIFKEVDLGLNLKLLKKSLKYSLPIVPHNLSSWAMNLADRLILNNISTLSLVGIFDIGAQIGKLINVITLGVNSAYSPWFFEQLKTDKNNKKNIAEITVKIVLLYVLVAIAISWLSPELLRLISSKAFFGAWKVVPFIAFAFVINGFYYSFSNVFFLEKTKYLPIITGVGAIINVSLNFILIPLYGIMGAAIASISSKLVFSAMAYWQSQRLFFIPYDLKKIILLIGLGFLISCFVFLFQDFLSKFNVLLTIAFKILILLGIALILYWKDRSLIISYICSKINRWNEGKKRTPHN